MIKIFFTTIFIAELIIAMALISKIRKINRNVNELNACITFAKPLIGDILISIRELSEVFCLELNEFILLVKKKKQEYMLKMAQTTLMYAAIFLLRGKYRRTFFAYQFVMEVLEGINELE